MIWRIQLISWRKVGRFKDKLEIQWELWALESEVRVIYDVRGWAMQPVGTLVVDGDSRNVWVREEYRRQGIATGICNVVEGLRREKLKPSSHLTPSGKAFWIDRVGPCSHGIPFNPDHLMNCDQCAAHFDAQRMAIAEEFLKDLADCS